MSSSASRTPGRSGRPPLSSRAAIVDAAGELFLENSYSKTTIEQITRRAGVSRASFFNYFTAKSDLLWGDVDDLVSAVGQLLSSQPPTAQPLEDVRVALRDATATIGADRIPLAVTQWELMGARDELLTSGLPRFACLAAMIAGYLERRSGQLPDALARAAAFAIVGAVAAAAGQWAGAGTRRPALSGLVDVAIAPVCAGYALAGLDGGTPLGD